MAIEQPNWVRQDSLISAEALVTIDDLKKTLALGNDDSLDDQLTVHLNTAHEEVYGYLIEKPETQIAYTAFYKNFGNSMNLQHGAVDISTIAVKYYNESSDLVEWGAENYYIDQTTDPLKLNFSTLPEVVSNNFENPIQIKYITNDQNKAGASIKTAILLKAQSLFHGERGESERVPFLTRAFNSLVTNFRQQ